ERLDEGDGHQRISRAETALCFARRARKRDAQARRAFPAQLQRRLAFGVLHLAEPPLQTRTERAGDRARLRAAQARAAHRLGRATSRPKSRRPRLRTPVVAPTPRRRSKATRRRANVT